MCCRAGVPSPCHPQGLALRQRTRPHAGADSYVVVAASSSTSGFSTESPSERVPFSVDTRFPGKSLESEGNGVGLRPSPGSSEFRYRNRPAATLSMRGSRIIADLTTVSGLSDSVRQPSRSISRVAVSTLHTLPVALSNSTAASRAPNLSNGPVGVVSVGLSDWRLPGLDRPVPAEPWLSWPYQRSAKASRFSRPRTRALACARSALRRSRSTGDAG
jgi:hypothetical protein